MKHRLYLSPPLTAGAERVLDAEQTHYVAHVLRLARGAELLCFDGAGAAWQATLTAISSRSATVRLDRLLEAAPPPAQRLHLVQGMLKGAAMDQVVQKATELGATDIWLVDAVRSNVSLDAGRLDRKRGHWLRVIESAAAQCRQWHLPTLHGPMKLDDCLTRLQGVNLILLDPGAPPMPLELPPGSVAALIGPEGGWTDAERSVARHHAASTFGLGALVLRAETAPLAVLAALRHSRHWS